MRIPHAVPGCADVLLPQLLRDGFCSTLILSPPGNGKTTLLRECVRRLSDMGTRISLMDERGEIAAVQSALDVISDGQLTLLATAIMALPVLPSVVITDMGLVNGANQTFVPVFADAEA